MLQDWKILVSTENIYCDDCIATVIVPPEIMEKYGEKKVLSCVLHSVARKTGDYRIMASAFIFSEINRVLPKHSELIEIEEKLIVQVKFSKEYECWEAVFWRGKCLADSVLNEMRDVVVAVIPPENPKLRERLRYEIEGARISRGRRTGGLLKKLNGTRIRPWTCRIKKKFIPEIERITKKI